MRFISVWLNNIKKYIKINRIKTSSFLLLLVFVLVWRLYLLADFPITSRVVPLQQHFLGGGMATYTQAPLLWSWANFDGEHYLGIAKYGYRPLTHFFFPLYPTLMGSLGRLLGGENQHFVIAGLIVSNLSFVFALFGLWKLLLLDYRKKTVLLTTVLILLFPTAFYFVSVYTESLFLLLAIWSFYFARKGRWWLAGLIGMALTATRLVGIVLLPALILEYILQYPYQNKKIERNVFALGLIPLGLFSYMYFLHISVSDAFAFFRSIEMYGAHRSARIVLLPQVFYRYVFKIIPVTGFSYWPSFFTIWLEFLTAVLFTTASIISIFKIRASYALFLIGGLFISTISGSFSSLPRYAIVLFPGFLVMALLINKLPKIVSVIAVILAIILLTLTQTLFLRGFWVS